MYRYIKASFDPSIPSWAKPALSAGTIGDDFVRQYNVPLSEVQFYTEEIPNSVPIYLLETDYADVVYIPGVNDDRTEFFNNRQRKLGSLGKSTLNKLAKDIVWVDVSNKLAPSKGYQDPRFIYDRYSRKGKGEYGGQYYNQPWTSYTGEEHPGQWSPEGRKGRNERHVRDKSGYVIPDPRDMLADYYTRFPDRLTNKLDDLKNKLISARDILFSEDLLVREDDPYDSSLSNAMRRYADAVHSYKAILNNIKHQTEDASDPYMKAYYFKDTINKIDSVKQDVNDALKEAKV